MFSLLPRGRAQSPSVGREVIRFTGEKRFEAVTNERPAKLAALRQMSHSHLFAAPNNLAFKQGGFD